MDILKVFDEKLSELGAEKVCNDLGIPKGIVTQYSNRKKTPGYATCQRIVDLWANGSFKSKEEKVEEDGSQMSANFDASGCLNMSYCPPRMGIKEESMGRKRRLPMHSILQRDSWSNILHFNGISHEVSNGDSITSSR